MTPPRFTNTVLELRIGTGIIRLMQSHREMFHLPEPGDLCVIATTQTDEPTYLICADDFTRFLQQCGATSTLGGEEQLRLVACISTVLLFGNMHRICHPTSHEFLVRDFGLPANMHEVSWEYPRISWLISPQVIPVRELVRVSMNLESRDIQLTHLLPQS